MEEKLFNQTVRQIVDITGYPEEEAGRLLYELETLLNEKKGALDEQDFIDAIHRMIKRNCKA